MSNKIITDYAAVSTPANTDTLLCMQSGVTKKLTASQILSLVNSDNVSLTDLEWMEESNAWTYASVDSTYSTYTGVISINADVTAVLTVGQKIKYVQDSTTKYAIIVEIGTYSGSATQITIFCGTSYLLTSSTITSPKYAMCYRPTDFPWQDSSIWSIERTYSSDANYTIPTGTYSNYGYNYPILNTVLGIGKWRILAKGEFSFWASTSSGGQGYIGIVAAATVSEVTTSNRILACDFSVYPKLGKFLPFMLYYDTGRTPYSLNIDTEITLTAMTKFWAATQKLSTSDVYTINIWGAHTPYLLTAICAYL